MLSWEIGPFNIVLRHYHVLRWHSRSARQPLCCRASDPDIILGWSLSQDLIIRLHCRIFMSGCSSLPSSLQSCLSSLCTNPSASLYLPFLQHFLAYHLEPLNVWGLRSAMSHLCYVLGRGFLWRSLRLGFMSLDWWQGCGSISCLLCLSEPHTRMWLILGMVCHPVTNDTR